MLYATLGAVEGLSKVSTGTLQSFSAQQLIDCAFGCTGSQIAMGFDYYKSHSKFALIKVFVPRQSIQPLVAHKHAKTKPVLSKSQDINQ